VQQITDETIKGLGAQAVKAAQELIEIHLTDQKLSPEQIKAGIEYRWLKAHSNRVIVKLSVLWQRSRIGTVMIRHEGGKYRMKVIKAGKSLQFNA